MIARAPRVFLSSVYREIDLSSGELAYFRIRRAIAEIGIDENVPVWVAEIERPDIGASTPWPINLKICIDEMYSCNALVVLLARGAGGLIELGGLGDAASRFFEMELLHAAQWKIPVVFYVLRGYEPEPELQNLIGILGLRNQKNWFLLEEKEILSHVRSLFRELKDRSLPDGWKLDSLHDLLSDARSVASVDKEISSSALSFIDRLAPRVKSDFDMRRVDYFLSFAEKEPVRSSLTDQLSYLWMAMRDLSLGDIRDPLCSKKWGEVVQRWSSVSAWLGLHGAVRAGVLAGFHTLNELERNKLPTGSEPLFGPYASEFYSMGLLSHKWRRRRFSAAVRLATKQAEARPRDPSGALAIRASAKLRLAALGMPWLVPSALSDYGDVLKTREKIGSDPSSIGEAMVELGFAKFQVANVVGLKPKGALATIREGVRLLEEEFLPARAGFVVRAKRKLAIALGRAGLDDEAQMQRESARSLAEKYRVMGQLEKMNLED